VIGAACPSHWRRLHLPTRNFASPFARFWQRQATSALHRGSRSSQWSLSRTDIHDRPLCFFVFSSFLIPTPTFPNHSAISFPCLPPHFIYDTCFITLSHEHFPCYIFFSPHLNHPSPVRIFFCFVAMSIVSSLLRFSGGCLAFTFVIFLFGRGGWIEVVMALGVRPSDPTRSAGRLWFDSLPLALFCCIDIFWSMAWFHVLPLPFCFHTCSVHFPLALFLLLAFVSLLFYLHCDVMLSLYFCSQFIFEQLSFFYLPFSTHADSSISVLGRSFRVGFPFFFR